MNNEKENINMRSEMLANFKIKLDLGFDAVVIYDEQTKLFALALVRHGQSVPEYGLAVAKEPDRVKWQNRFPLADIQRLGLDHLKFSRINLG